MDNIQIQDESGDKKYFTIIPNYIANHSTANDQALYFQMKKHAGENGECFVSEKTLKEKLGIGGKALHKSIEYLLSHNWIQENGFKEVMTQGGVQKIRAYKIIDIWKVNTEHYEGVSKRKPLEAKGCPKEEGGVSKSNQRGSLLSNKEEPYINKNHINNTAPQAVQDKIDINKFISLFEPINPSYERLFSNKTQRGAMERLIKKFGEEKMEATIKALPEIIIKPYAPKITTPYDLERDFGKLITFYKQSKVADNTKKSRIIK